MGLAIPDDEDSPSPLPPASAADAAEWQAKVLASEAGDSEGGEIKPLSPTDDGLSCHRASTPEGLPQHMDNNVSPGALRSPPSSGGRKRLFDVESLLAPDDGAKQGPSNSYSEHINVVDSDERVKAEDSDDEVIDVDSTKVDGEENILKRSMAGESREDEESDRLSPPVKVMRPGTPGSVSEQRSPSPARSDGQPAGSSGSPAAARGPWASPLTVGTSWPSDHPSAFHSATPSTVTAWSSLPPHGFPIMSAPYPIPAHGASPAEALAAQQRWQETFSRIMARSYGKNLKLEA